MFKRLSLILGVLVCLYPHNGLAQEPLQEFWPQIPNYNHLKDLLISNLTDKQKIILSRMGQITLFSTDKNSLQFRKINPAKYKLTIHAAKGIVPILLNNSFHPDWKLYITKALPTDSNNTCDNFYETWLPGTIKISYDQKKHKLKWQQHRGVNRNIIQYPDEMHFKANGFANCWLIDIKALEKALSASDRQDCFLKKNPDQSIDLEVILEFTGQKALYLGTLVTLGILLVLLTYIILVTFINRHKLHEVTADT